MSHYRTLGVAISDTTQQIRAAYHALARANHPDKGGDSGAMAVITQAYVILKDPKRRRLYDDQLKIAGAPCAGCSGKGRRYRSKGITERTSVICPDCYGAGFVPTTRRNWRG